MTVKIFKYPFHIDDQFTVMLPPHNKVIHAGLDPSGTPCIWAEVDTSTPAAYLHPFFVRGTGHEVPENAKHIGSFVDGGFVWHIYSGII